MDIIILGFLILLNGLFSMSEIALVSARKARLESQADRGDKRAKLALEMSSHPELFFIVCSNRYYAYRYRNRRLLR